MASYNKMNQIIKKVASMQGRVNDGTKIAKELRTNNSSTLYNTSNSTDMFSIRKTTQNLVASERSIILLNQEELTAYNEKSNKRRSRNPSSTISRPPPYQQPSRQEIWLSTPPSYLGQQITTSGPQPPSYIASILQNQQNAQSTHRSENNNTNIPVQLTALTSNFQIQQGQYQNFSEGLTVSRGCRSNSDRKIRAGQKRNRKKTLNNQRNAGRKLRKLLQNKQEIISNQRFELQLQQRMHQQQQAEWINTLRNFNEEFLVNDKQQDQQNQPQNPQQNQLQTDQQQQQEQKEEQQLQKGQQEYIFNFDGDNQANYNSIISINQVQDEIVPRNILPEQINHRLSKPEELKNKKKE